MVLLHTLMQRWCTSRAHDVSEAHRAACRNTPTAGRASGPATAPNGSDLTKKNLKKLKAESKVEDWMEQSRNGRT
jgi:hypothetical protein